MSPVMVVLCGMNSKSRTLSESQKICLDLSVWLLHTKFLGSGDSLCFHCMDSCLASGLWWLTHVDLIILEKKFSGFLLSMSKLLTACFLLRSQHSWLPSGTDLWQHQDWMDDIGNCANWNVQFMSYNTDLNATILQNHVLQFSAHFFWRCFH